MRPPITIFKIADRSMEPTVEPGDYVLVNGWFGRIRNGDIVVLRHPSKDMFIIKRVSRVENGRYFVVGDNSGLSQDSREFGAVDGGLIVGRVFFISRKRAKHHSS